MWTRLLHRLFAAGQTAAQALRRRVAAAPRPETASLVTGTLAYLMRTKPELLAENALLRQQLIILRRQVTRPRCRPAERVRLVLLASRLRTWRHAVLIVPPDTLLRWHRRLFRWSWRRTSQPTAPAHHPPLPAETIA